MEKPKQTFWSTQYESNINGVTEELADQGVLTLLSLKTLHTQPEELSVGKFTGRNEESVTKRG